MDSTVFEWRDFELFWYPYIRESESAHESGVNAQNILTKCWQSSNWSGIKVGGWGKICVSFSLKVELNNKLFDICRFHNSQFARQVSQDAVPSSRLDARLSWTTSRPTSRQRGPDAGIQVVFAFFSIKSYFVLIPGSWKGQVSWPLTNQVPLIIVLGSWYHHQRQDPPIMIEIQQ